MSHKQSFSRFLLSLILSVTLVLPSFSFSENIIYTYDDLNRMTSVEYPDGRTVQYTYDEVGNRLQKNSLPPDTTPPTGSISINGGAAYTNSPSVTLSLSCIDDRVCSQMQFSNDNMTWSVAEAYSTTKQWTLTAGDGNKTVSVKYKDRVGNWSSVYSASIVLDITAPVDGILTATPAVGQITLNWTGFSDNVSGINRYILAYDPTGVPSSCSTTTCPAGMTYSAQHNACIQAATPVCTAGTTWNVATSKCEQTPTCPTGGTYNAATDRCEATLTNTYQCSYNSVVYDTSAACSSACVQTAACNASTVCTQCMIYNSLGEYFPVSPGGNFTDPSTGAYWSFDLNCVATIDLAVVCTVGSYCSYAAIQYGQNLSSCSINYTCPISGGSACDGSHNCSKSYSCSTLNNCPSGYSYNGSACVATAACSVGSLNSASDTCQSNPTNHSCSQGSYDPAIGQCKVVSTATQLYTGLNTSYGHVNPSGGAHNYRLCAVDNAENTSSGATASTTNIFTVTASTNGNGTLVCNSPVNYGDNSTCTITPNAGYYLQTLTDNTVDVTTSVTGNTYRITNVTGNHAVAAVFALDNTVPTGSIVINNGDTYTNNGIVALTLSCSDNIACSQMQFSNDNATWTAVEAYSTTRQWTLTAGDGNKSVFVKYKDISENWSVIYSANIILDTTAPTGGIAINGGVSATNNTTVTLTLSCTDANGCSQMQFSNDNATWTAVEVYSTTKQWTLTAGDGNKSVSVKYKDMADNWSIVYSASISLDTIVPSSTASPAGGTYSSAQSVTLSCSDTGGSGCDKIYYTTDNTTPTTSSAFYSNSINVSVTATLKYFAVDMASNNGTMNSQTYTINTVPTGIRIAGTQNYYSTIQAAYNAAVSGDVIQVQAGNLVENIDVNRNITVTVEGGYSSDFLTKVGMTTVKGKIQTFVGSGKITVSNITLNQ